MNTLHCVIHKMGIDLIYKYLQFFVEWFVIIKHRWNDKKLK